MLYRRGETGRRKGKDMAFAEMNFFSTSLKRTVNFNVVIPTDKVLQDGTMAGADHKFPTLYLFHGVFGDYTDWVHGTRLQRLAQDRGICVVMPSGDNKFYCDSEISGDLYGRYIAEELPAFTRRTLPVSEKREETFIGGLSMGGFGALVNGLRHPETFSRIAALSAALIKEQILGSYDEPGHDIFTKRQYCTMFGLDGYRIMRVQRMIMKRWRSGWRAGMQGRKKNFQSCIWQADFRTVCFTGIRTIMRSCRASDMT